MSRRSIPGWEGSVGPFRHEYHKFHIYARDVHSDTGNCVCGNGLGDWLHVQAAPGIPIPDDMRSAPSPTVEGLLDAFGKIALLIGAAHESGEFEQSSTWQSIATAPRDGTPIIAARVARRLDGKRHEVLVRWSSSQNAWVTGTWATPIHDIEGWHPL